MAASAMAFYLEEQFIESPIFDNWFKKHYPQKSLLICTPYIKKDAVDRVINLYKLNERGGDFDLRVLIRGNPGEFIGQKSSDISALDALMALPCADASNIRRVQNLHMKAYLIDDTYLLITSGNLTNSGMFVVSGKENFEGGIATRNPALTCSFLKYFKGFWDQGQGVAEFYDELLGAYTDYIEKAYSEKTTGRCFPRKKYAFPSRSSLEAAVQPAFVSAADTGPTFGQILDSPPAAAKQDAAQIQPITLDDLPPVGSLSHLPEILRIADAHPAGIAYLELGRLLRIQFGEGRSNSDDANRKFGEEKGKFAAFLGLVSIVNANGGKRIVSNRLGAAYMAMSRENQERMIKDIFFDKPILVSLMRKSLESEDFDLLQFLMEHCQGTQKTLARKVGSLKELFAHIRSIYTDAELQDAMQSI